MGEQLPKAATSLMSSNDPELAGLKDTPAPVACEFCGKPRHTKGFQIGARIMWMPSGPEVCSCPKAQKKLAQEKAEAIAQQKAAEKAERDEQMRKRVSKVIGESGLGERFLQRTFETYIADTSERRKIAGAALAYARGFDSKLPKRGEPLPGRNGLLISGTKGTGKTHIAAAIANYLLHRGTAVICMTERNLFGKIQDTFQRNKGFGEHGQTESQIRNIYETVPLLIIDDLGKEKASEWTLATLYAIIDGRYDRAMPTVITTNYDTESLVQRLTPAGGDATTADTVVDRLKEMCESIITTGESWRTK